jgi:hypothetical protein
MLDEVVLSTSKYSPFLARDTQQRSDSAQRVSVNGRVSPEDDSSLRSTATTALPTDTATSSSIRMAAITDQSSKVALLVHGQRQSDALVRKHVLAESESTAAFRQVQSLLYTSAAYIGQPLPAGHSAPGALTNVAAAGPGPVHQRSSFLLTFFFSFSTPYISGIAARAS